MKHIVMFSGGIGSWAAAKRVTDTHGPENVTLLFADTAGDGTEPFLGEDPDCYRFIRESAAQLGANLVWLKEGRNIWQVFHDRRFLGNSRQANCSTELKQKPCRAWLNEHCDPQDTTVYIGIDWSEEHRKPAIEKAYAPYKVGFPMTEPPYMDKQQMLEWCQSEGVTPPRMYREGWAHANCQAGCVRAGKAHWRKLLTLYPERYLYHEQREQELRDYLGKDVAILSDSSADDDPNDIGGCGCFTAEELPEDKGSKKVPLTLRAFRERIENSTQDQLFDLGGYL
ncbi:PAPS reductase-like domain protein [Mycobacterium phage Martik]|uniref:PAPS reductase-like domain protein n=5 Tax=Cheoctovirus TaxID=1623281 RepID=G1DUR6_9CAUD|nr:phosphoadenosine phosphosulfate reductase [Mycobacterium phage Drago]YP_009202585.1 phosphoadenosine phosphosulfate reductase [Mycobacterium phage Phatniss]YP_009608147.1 phosphoadenosine phosphosulfate reductase [Mycobacterium phage ShiLan]YP_655062.1 phosphoadenosine phosphosulfate reductase [Mycobacterium phage Llij]AVO21570.1 PAPS reductase-like domain protein [Mycobacterium phage UncleRicky]AVO24519.1 hypothetical protein SEA_ALEXPHANDER_73 [Mycobacterium phage Alexphander]QAY10998.1 